MSRKQRAIGEEFREESWCSAGAVSLASLVLIVICNSFCAAQIDTSMTLPDTSESSSVTGTERTGEGAFHPRKSAWLAVGLSAAVPGVGQIYNENYWKAPVVWALGGYWISEWIQLNKSYKDYRDKFSASITSELPYGDGQFLQLRNYYGDERDKFAWYLGALYFLNLLDAYVGANLYDFDVGPDLGANGKITPRVAATIRVKF